MITKQTLQHINSSQDGRSNGAISSNFEHGGLCQNSSIRTLRRKFSAFKDRSLQSVYSIMPGEAFIEECVVRIDQPSSGPIVDDQVCKKELTFLHHRTHQPPIASVLRVKFTIGVCIVDLIQLEPGVKKFLHETVELRLIDQSVNLLLQVSGDPQLSGAGQFAKRFIRHRFSEEEGESLRQGKVIEFAGLAALEKKLWRSQYCREGSNHCLSERSFFKKNLGILIKPIEFLLCNGTSISPFNETGKYPSRIFRRVFRESHDMFGALLERQISKQRKVGRWRPFFDKRSIHFHPMKSDTGKPVIGFWNGMRHCRNHG